MRNLLINLTFALALISFSFTGAYSQNSLNLGNTNIITTQDIAITIETGATTTTYRGGIVVPIIQISLPNAPREEGVIINVRVMQDRYTAVYEHIVNYSSNVSTQEWELIIPSSEVNTWGSGSYTLVVESNMNTTTGEEDVIRQVITIE